MSGVDGGGCEDGSGRSDDGGGYGDQTVIGGNGGGSGKSGEGSGGGSSSDGDGRDTINGQVEKNIFSQFFYLFLRFT